MTSRTLKVLLLATALLVAAAADAATLDVSPTSVSQGASVTATWSGMTSPTSTDWIALAVPGSANTSYISWRYTTGTASGNVPFTVPSTVAPGTYQLRLFANNGYTLLATSANFTVTLPNVNLTASPASVLPGGIETVAWDGIPGPATNNWVGLYTPTAADTAYISWRYTTGTASGNVPFTVPATVTPGTYQLRIFSSGYTRLATSANFTVGLSVGGTVTVSGAPLANVAFAATNGGYCGSSNASGQYACSVPIGWSGGITPQLTGYIFAPASRTYSNVTVAQTAQNYSATPIFPVSGTVLFNGSPLSNVTFTATNGVTCSASSASGQYSCNVPQWWSGTVTASLSGYLFTPATRHYANVNGNQSAQDYAAAPHTSYLVTGTVNVNGAPLANVTFAAPNGGICSLSNAWGQYSCAVAPGWSGTVTPSATGYSFTPATRSLSNIANDQGAQDFSATLVSASAPMFFFHVDHLNTPRLVADASGTTVWKWDQQEPFGNNVADENPSGLGAFDLPLRLPGQYSDKETNLYYNYFRDYDPYLGRYQESDPIGLRGGINTYAYVKGNPVTRIDPTGESGIALAPAAPAGGLAVPAAAVASSGIAGWLIGSALYPYIELPIANALDACFANSPAVPSDRIDRCKEAFKKCLGDLSITEDKCFKAYSSCIKTTNPFIFPGYGVVK